MTAWPFWVCHVAFEKLIILFKNDFTHIPIANVHQNSWSIRAIKSKL